MSATVKKIKFDTSMTEELKDLLVSAARVSGFNTMTEFVLQASREKAIEVMKEREAILATEEDKKIFFRSIVNPPPPNKRLRKAAEKYLKKVNV
jgi:uncharacterized protein (DUF1778 family)